MKIKIPADQQKVIKYLLVHKRLKRANEIQDNNSRITIAIRGLYKEGVLEKDKGGYYLTDKNPMLKFLKDAYGGNNPNFNIGAKEKELIMKMKNPLSEKTLTDVGKQLVEAVKKSNKK